MLKKCSRCKLEKPLEEFPKDRATKDGLSYQCKLCHREMKAKYRQSPEAKAVEAAYQREYAKKPEAQERKRQSDQMYRQENRKILNAKQAEYYRNTYDKQREYFREYYAKNRDHCKQRVLQWAKDNPEKVNVRNQRRRARVRDVSGKYSVEEWRALCQKYDNCCLCCGKKLPLTVDHIIPISWGGSNDITNIQPLCKQCNSEKGATAVDFRPDSKTSILTPEQALEILQQEIIHCQHSGVTASIAPFYSNGTRSVVIVLANCNIIDGNIVPAQ